MPLELHDVRDAERLAAWVIQRSGLGLDREDREDLQQTLLLAVWQLSLQFDVAAGKPFGPFATTVLRRRLVDWQRQRFGRTRWQFKGSVYERPRPEFVPLDDSVRDRLDEADAKRSCDGSADLDPTCRWLWDTRDCCRAVDLRELDPEGAGWAA